MRNILVTGGTGGVGREIVALLCSDESNHVTFTYCNNGIRAAELVATHQNSDAVKCDFRSKEDIDALESNLEEREIGCIVNNAIATFKSNHFHKFDPIDISNGFMHNVLPTVKLFQAALRVFRKKRSGRFITILSSGVIGVPPAGYAAYTAEKAYLMSINKSIVSENSNFNIVANCVSPSFMQTELTNSVDKRLVEAMAASHPLKQILKVTDVAETVAFLVNAPAHINGVNIPINAGVNVI
jgi:3-oxoacyl-[acyl-carrier protein] reductase